MPDDATLHPTIHGSAVVYRRFGLLVLGPSGSGKSTLINALIEHAVDHNEFCQWVGDDRLQLSRMDKTVIVRPAPNLKGLSERHYLGIESGLNLASAAIDLVVELHPRAELERLPDSQSHEDFPEIPLLAVPEKDAVAAISLILARITTL